MNFFILLITLSGHLFSRSEVIDTKGATVSYFYNLKTGEKTELFTNDWHLSFKSGAIAGTIRTNKNTTLYEAIVLDIDAFGQTVSDADLSNPDKFKTVYNDNTDWLIGAFNQGGFPEQDFDYGWGSYVQGDGIYGSKFYVLEINLNGSKVYKQLLINSMKAGVYSISTCELDGTNKLDYEIKKSDFSDKYFGYFNVLNGTLSNSEPVVSNWDLFFGEYVQELDAGGGVTIPYAVVGALQHPSLFVAKKEGTLTERPDNSNFQFQINTIGHDWKTFNGSAYVYTDSVYFCQKFGYNSNQDLIPVGDLYKIKFISYEGGQKKIINFEVEEIISSVNEENYVFGIYPNVISSNENISIVSNMNGSVNLKLLDINGNILLDKNVIFNSKLNEFQMQLPNLSNGLYFINLNDGINQLNQKIIIK